MPLKAVLRDASKERIHFSLIVDVFRENVLVGGLSGRAMHKEEVSFTMGPMQFAQEVPTTINHTDGARAIFETVARPINRSKGDRIETFWVEEGGLIVIAKDGDLTASNHFVQTLAWIWSIANNVAETVNLFDVLGSNIGQNDPQGVVIGMNITNERAFHRSSAFN